MIISHHFIERNHDSQGAGFGLKKLAIVRPTCLITPQCLLLKQSDNYSPLPKKTPLKSAVFGVSD